MKKRIEQFLIKRWSLIRNTFLAFVTVSVVFGLIRGTNFVLLDPSNSNIFFSLFDLTISSVTLVFTFYMMCAAFMAFKQSKKTLESTMFNSVFNTQIGLLRSYFSNSIVGNTVLINDKSCIPLPIAPTKFFQCQWPNVSLYKNFCLYFQENAKEIAPSELTSRLICNIWKEYSDNLRFKSEFEYSFKYIYLCISTITNACISDKEKESYIEIVRNLINSDQLFCYFVNLITICDGDCESDKTVRILRENDFFRDMFITSFFKDIREVLPINIVKCFSNFNKQ